MWIRKWPKEHKIEIGVENFQSGLVKLDDVKADVHDPLEEVNIGDEAEKRPIYINAALRAYFK